MILLSAMVAGAFAGLGRAWARKRALRSITLRWGWVVAAAFFLQVLVFQVPFIGSKVPVWLAAFALPASLIALLAFAWLNIRKPGLWALALGLAMNLAVITLNGGLMPITPDTVERISSRQNGAEWQIGERFGTSKDIVRRDEDTRLGFLSDRLTLPIWIPYQAAFSIGDVFIALGAFLFLWSLGANNFTEKSFSKKENST